MDSQQVLQDQIGRILAESGVTCTQAQYIRDSVVKMISDNILTLSTEVEVDHSVANPHPSQIGLQGIAEIAKMMASKGIYIHEKPSNPGPIKTHVIKIHLIRF